MGRKNKKVEKKEFEKEEALYSINHQSGMSLFRLLFRAFFLGDGGDPTRDDREDDVTTGNNRTLVLFFWVSIW